MKYRPIDNNGLLPVPETAGRPKKEIREAS